MVIKTQIQRFNNNMHYIFKQNLYDVLEYPKSIFNMVFNEMIREINNLINRNRLIH